MATSSLSIYRRDLHDQSNPYILEQTKNGPKKIVYVLARMLRPKEAAWSRHGSLRLKKIKIYVKNQISNFGLMSYGHFLARNGSKA